jgi:hypothetical protein
VAAPWSAETRLALAPGRTYPTLVDEAARAGWRGLASRAVMIVFVLGVFIPIIAVQRVTLSLVVTSALAWSFILAVQIFLGAAVVASAPARRTGTTAALNLWLAGHLPYSIWMLIVAALSVGTEWISLGTLVALAVMPSAWTSVIVAAFCRAVLATSRGGARTRAAIHTAAVWTMSLLYVAWSAGGWFQVTDPITRWWRE